LGNLESSAAMLLFHQPNLLEIDIFGKLGRWSMSMRNLLRAPR
jgi:hypothetical protein